MLKRDVQRFILSGVLGDGGELVDEVMADILAVQVTRRPMSDTSSFRATKA